MITYQITKRGGICIPLVVDHENDTQLKELFEKIDKEQDGRLDILVNNAYKAVDVHKYLLIIINFNLN